MKPFKTLGSIALTASALILATSCSKNMDDQLAKGENEIGKLAVTSCAPFVGLQTRQNNMGQTYVFYGNYKTPFETQAFYGSDFTANNLITFSATGGTPFHSSQFNRIGVNDHWVNAGEVLSLKLNGTLFPKGSNRMVMLVRSDNLSGAANFYLNGSLVGSLALSSGANMEQLLEYEAVGENADFNEVRFVPSAGRIALMGYTPNLVTPGPSGFYLVEGPGTAVVGRFRSGTTTIDGIARPNQFFTLENGYTAVPAIERQNKLPGTSGEFPAGQWVGAKHWVNISGSATLGYGSPSQYRLGVGNAIIDAGEVITITPGADFPAPKFRSVEVREATLLGSTLLIEVWNGATLIASKVSTGVDAGFTLINPGQEFDKVTIKANSGTDVSLGRPTPGPIAANFKLYPGCPAP